MVAVRCGAAGLGSVGRSRWLLKLGVLGLGFAEDRDVRVGVFSEREEILVGRAPLIHVAGSSVGAPQTEMCQRKQGIERKEHPLL